MLEGEECAVVVLVPLRRWKILDARSVIQSTFYLSIRPLGVHPFSSQKCIPRIRYTYFENVFLELWFFNKISLKN